MLDWLTRPYDGPRWGALLGLAFNLTMCVLYYRLSRENDRLRGRLARESGPAEADDPSE